MPVKVLMGVSAAMALGLAIVFWLLLQEKETNGALVAEIDEAVRANQSQTKLIGRLEQERQDAKKRFEAERARADMFVVRIAETEQALEAQKHEFTKQIAGVRKQLTVDELECADERIPLAYFDNGVRKGKTRNPNRVH